MDAFQSFSSCSPNLVGHFRCQRAPSILYWLVVAILLLAAAIRSDFAGTPSLSLPMGFGENGLPVGIQFATRPGGEALLLALAYQIEAAVEWRRYRPRIWVADD